jgi:hypothetical protein
MGRRTDFHRWDDVTPDTRGMRLREDTLPQWSHSVHSNFAEPSRLGDLERERKPRRSALALIVGVTAAAAVAGATALFVRGAQRSE